MSEKTSSKKIKSVANIVTTAPKDLPTVAATLAAAVIAKLPLSEKPNDNIANAVKLYEQIFRRLSRKSGGASADEHSESE